MVGCRDTLVGDVIPERRFFTLSTLPTPLVGDHTGGYSPTAAGFCMPGPLFAKAVHISQPKIGPGVHFLPRTNYRVTAPTCNVIILIGVHLPANYRFLDTSKTQSACRRFVFSQDVSLYVS